MQIAEFFVGLFFDSDQKAVDNFDNSLQGLQDTISSLKVAAVAVAVERIADAATQATSRLRSFQAQTSISIEELQRLQSAANVQNISLSFDQVASSLQAVESNLAQIRLGGGNVAPFQLLGIDITGKNALQVMEDVRQAIKGLDDATATNLIQQIGFSPEFIRLLRLSRSEMDAMAQEGMLGEEQLRRVESLGREMAKFRQQVKFLADTFVSSFQPVIERVFAVLTSITSGFRMLIDLAGRSELAIAGITTAALALAKAFKPVTLAMTLLLLVLDDIATFARGGDSLFGLLLDGVDKLAKRLDELVPQLEIFDRIQSVPFGGLFGKEIFEFAQSGAASITNTFSNIFNINSSADGEKVARDVVSEQQRMLNDSLADFNNGALN